jgi:hypothetical protein
MPITELLMIADVTSILPCGDTTGHLLTFSWFAQVQRAAWVDLSSRALEELGQ